MKAIIIILTFIISISFAALLFNSVVVKDIGANGSNILQLSSFNDNLCFLTNNSLNLYNFKYTKTVYLNSPISMKIYDNIYVHAADGLYVYNKKLKLLKVLKGHFFDFDYDPDTKTVFLFKGNSLDLMTNFKTFKIFSFDETYNYFSYDSFNKKIVLAKSNGDFVVVDQILFSVKKYSYNNYDFKNVLSFNGKTYFLDSKGLLSFDYLVLRKLPFNPLWMIKKDSHLFLIFNTFVMDYVTSDKYDIPFILKDVAVIDSTLYFLYQNNFIVNSNKKTYYLVSNFKSIFYNGNITLYDPDRALFKSNTKSKYTTIHFINLRYDNLKHYVIGFDESYLYFLDNDFNIISKIKLNFLPTSIQLDKINSVVFLKDSESKIFSYDYSNGLISKFKQVDCIKIFIPKYFEYYSFSNHTIKIMDSYSKVLSSFNTNSLITGAVFSDYFDALFFTTYDGQLYEYDLTLNQIVKVQKIALSANMIVAANDSIYILDSNDQKIFRVYSKK